MARVEDGVSRIGVLAAVLVSAIVGYGCGGTPACHLDVAVPASTVGPG